MLKKCNDHLESVSETYIEHLCFAASVGLRMIGGGIAVILHGIFPAIFQYTGSSIIRALYEKIQNRTKIDHHHG
jgi:hypothetical protein